MGSSPVVHWSGSLSMLPFGACSWVCLSVMVLPAICQRTGAYRCRRSLPSPGCIDRLEAAHRLGGLLDRLLRGVLPALLGLSQYFNDLQYRHANSSIAYRGIKTIG